MPHPGGRCSTGHVSAKVSLSSSRPVMVSFLLAGFWLIELGVLVQNSGTGIVHAWTPVPMTHRVSR